MPERLVGIVPPMTTPFNRDGSVDTEAFRQEVWYLMEAGVQGLAVGGSTGEGQTLTEEEVWTLAEIAVQEAEGRVPVVVGIIVDSTQQAVARGRMLRSLEVTALQITPVHYLFTPNEQEMYDFYATIGSEVGLPILIYNVVPWSYASPALLDRMITEVNEVVGVKQSAGDMHALAELLARLGDRGVVMAAVDDLLYPCFALGAHGAIAAILTAVPGLLPGSVGGGAGGLACRSAGSARAAAADLAGVERIQPAGAGEDGDGFAAAHRRASQGADAACLTRGGGGDPDCPAGGGGDLRRKKGG